MKYQYIPMKEEYANEIINNWHYDGIYSFYDITTDEKDLKVFTDRAYWKDTIFAVLNENNELVAWSSFYIENEIVWLSLGLKPELTGIGLGEEFVFECVNFAQSHYKPDKKIVKFDVALFNQRAIKVYERVGFSEFDRVIKHTSKGKVEFIQMKRDLAS
jgi:ribosomal-protein-alanine N-acetyltransferase